MSARRDLLLGWYLPLVLGLLLLLVTGFLLSALADRTVFAGWALASAAAYTVVFRQGIAAGWSKPRRAGSVGLVLALAFGWLAYLIHVHREILDLGARAVLPWRPA